MSAAVHQLWALLARCAAPSPVHDYVHYTVIIGGLLHAYHMYHMEYSAVLQMTELSIRLVSICKFDTENLPSRPT